MTMVKASRAAYRESALAYSFPGEGGGLGGMGREWEGKRGRMREEVGMGDGEAERSVPVFSLSFLIPLARSPPTAHAPNAQTSSMKPACL